MPKKRKSTRKRKQYGRGDDAMPHHLENLINSDYELEEAPINIRTGNFVDQRKNAIEGKNNQIVLFRKPEEVTITQPRVQSSPQINQQCKRGSKKN